jgi:RNA polymerase sigma-70 factor (ECF subfamily)
VEFDSVAREASLVDALRCGDESAFVTLVDRYHMPMLRVAARFVSSDTVAEEVVQDTWLGVLQGLIGSERESSLKTWLSRFCSTRPDGAAPWNTAPSVFRLYQGGHCSCRGS